MKLTNKQNHVDIVKILSIIYIYTYISSWIKLDQVGSPVASGLQVQGTRLGTCNPIPCPLLARQIALCWAAWLPPPIVPAWRAEDPGVVKIILSRIGSNLSLPGVQNALEWQNLFFEPYRQLFVPARSAEGPGEAIFAICVARAAALVTVLYNTVTSRRRRPQEAPPQRTEIPVPLSQDQIEQFELSPTQPWRGLTPNFVDNSPGPYLELNFEEEARIEIFEISSPEPEMSLAVVNTSAEIAAMEAALAAARVRAAEQEAAQAEQAEKTARLQKEAEDALAQQQEQTQQFEAAVASANVENQDTVAALDVPVDLFSTDDDDLNVIVSAAPSESGASAGMVQPSNKKRKAGENTQDWLGRTAMDLSEDTPRPGESTSQDQGTQYRLWRRSGPGKKPSRKLHLRSMVHGSKICLSKAKYQLIAVWKSSLVR